MTRAGVVGRPPAFGHDVAMAQEHEAVQRIDVAVGRIDEVENDGRRNALRLGGRARQLGCGTDGTTQSDQCDDGESLHIGVLTRTWDRR